MSGSAAVGCASHPHQRGPVVRSFCTSKPWTGQAETLDSPHPCRTCGVARPAERLDSTALSRRSLIRMRSQVQVLAGPPPVTTSENACPRYLGAGAAAVHRMTPHIWHNFLRCLGQSAASFAPIVVCASSERGGYRYLALTVTWSASLAHSQVTAPSELSRSRLPALLARPSLGSSSLGDRERFGGGCGGRCGYDSPAVPRLCRRARPAAGVRWNCDAAPTWPCPPAWGLVGAWQSGQGR
jgi:hypothetical protein